MNNIKLILFIIALTIIINIIFIYIEQPSFPVESIRIKESIDSASKTNAKIIIEIHSLDSIKNEKKIEVTNLDNDSTLKLFYELIRD